MNEPDRSATVPWDTVVELSGVSKTFKQRQPGETLREAINGLVRPRIRQVHALRHTDSRIRAGGAAA